MKTIAESICEEFCSRISVSTKRECDSLLESSESYSGIPEIKCALHKDYFPELFKRMNQIGYSCTQVQNHAKFQRCVAWFEPCENE
tara:strand:+ start:80 stop:337 length:258 start_codon:yes stop_codon:yes gene_type:complete